ncbi:cation:proton antiporter, partial [Anaerolinea sp.]
MNIVIVGLAFLGAFFIFLASIGILRMPDLFLRMSATAKAGTLGVGTLLFATIL